MDKNTIDSILDGRIGNHMERLDYLAICASEPSADSIREGVELIRSLELKIKKQFDPAQLDDSMTSATSLSSLMNAKRISSAVQTYNLNRGLTQLLKRGINIFASLPMAVLFNIVARDLEIGNFAIIAEGDNFAPLYHCPDFEVSIFVKDAQNSGLPTRFSKGKERISTLEAIARLAGHNSERPNMPESKKAYLKAFAASIRGLLGHYGLFSRPAFPSLGAEYKHYRTVLNYTQFEIAALAAISRQAYANYEANLRNPDAAVDSHIRHAFNLPTHNLVSGEDYRKRREEMRMDVATLAKEVGLNPRTLIRYETGIGTPPLDVALKMNRILGLRMIYFPSGD